MTLLEQIRSDQLQARKNREALKAALLTTLIGDADMIGKNDGNRATTDDEVLKIIKKYIANIKETPIPKGSGSSEYALKLMSELIILETYLPKQLSETELENVIKDIVASVGATSLKDMGKIMKTLKEQYSGTYDGAMANALVKKVFVV